jgi:2,3-diketo-5-methylthio-1-phosphopentane phosphatase
MTDKHGFGTKKRQQGDQAILNGTDTYRDGFLKMVDSWTTSLPETIEILKANIKLDPHFPAFMAWANANAVPVVVLSSGMVPIIRALLDQMLDDKELVSSIEIVANEAQPKPPINDLNKPGGWTVNYHDDSGFGHDKSLTIRPYAEAIAKSAKGQPRPTLLYAGDGVSDLSAARETDLLFAKKGHDLITYCEREEIPFTVFEDWSSILEMTKEIFEGKTNVKDLAEETLELVRSNSLTNGTERTIK